MWQLREYQQEAVNAAKSHLIESDEPAILDLATGAGKSLIIAALAEWIHKAGKRVLVLTHSSDLVAQNAAKYRATGAKCGIYSAKLNKKEAENHVIFAGVQSVARNLDYFAGFSLVVIDECHLVSDDKTSSYQRIFSHLREHNPKLRILGLTATPSRGKQSLVGKNNTFKHCVYRVDTQYLINLEFLAPVVYGDNSADAYGLGKLKTNSMGKLDSSEVATATEGKERKTRAIVDAIVRIMDIQDRKLGMIFASTVKHAHEILSYLPFGQGIIVTGETSAKERERILTAARSGKIRYLVNCAVLTTGVDLPICDCVALLRATESKALFLQIIGRGLRIHPEKRDCLLLDYGGNLNRHGTVEDEFLTGLEEQKEKAGSDKPQKMCPECRSMSNALARRCKAPLYDGLVDRICGYRFEFKTCESCGCEDNDIAARNCSRCDAEFIDPNAKLTDIASTVIHDFDALPVIQTIIGKHTKNGRHLLKVEHSAKDKADQIVVVSEYFYDVHESPFVLRKYGEFLNDLGLTDWARIDDVVKEGKEYKGFSAVVVKRAGKYLNVHRRVSGDSPVIIERPNATWRGLF